jgi:hypothetical protein
MRVRHRIPSIFNLSMVDVLCCALGCVILLWLLNLRTAKEYEDNAETETREARAQLALLNERIRELEEKRSSLQSALSDREAASRELERKWKDSTARVAALEADLAASKSESGMRATRVLELEKTTDLVPGLRADLKEARAKLAAEEAQAQALEKEMALRRKELDDSAKSLQTLQAAKKALERDLENRDRDLALTRSYREKWTAAEDRLKLREKELADAGRTVETLLAEKKTLLTQVSAARTDAENRFAGIQLTGRRVVFLVDTSGSMEYVDEQTKVPTKWPEVARTVGRIMRSLPELEKFQVITFAEKPSFLLGSDGRWLDYDAKETPDRAVKALTDLKPTGGTNMYSAIDAAFRLRKDGLDTVYLLSDGLPNIGEGLKPEEGKNLSEVERGAILGKYIRKALKTDWNRDLRTQPRVRINAVGFFYESPDVGAFLWALARENDGSFVGMSRP